MMDALEEFMLCIKGFVNAYKRGGEGLGKSWGRGGRIYRMV